MKFIAENIVSMVEELGRISVFSNNFIFVIVHNIATASILLRGFPIILNTKFYIKRRKKFQKKRKPFLICCFTLHNA